MSKTLLTKIILRHDTATNWTLVNPVLLPGEIGIEDVTSKLKIGNGTDQWTQLPYLVSDVTVAEVIGLLDVNGYIKKSLIPAIAINNVFPVESEVELLALNATVGDVAIRTDTTPIKAFMLNSLPSNDIGNWTELTVNVDAVQTVNGQIGNVVLDTADIAENTNLYHTDTRVNALINSSFNTLFDARIAVTTVDALQDGDTVYTSVNLTQINGGGA